MRHIVLWSALPSHGGARKMAKKLNFIVEIENLRSCIIEITSGVKSELAILLDSIATNLSGFQVQVKHITNVTGDCGPRIGYSSTESWRQTSLPSLQGPKPLVAEITIR